jgi:hypothetical protein
MPADTSNLYLLQDLSDLGGTTHLESTDLTALRTVANWITGFVANPHKDLGRAGPVCPFVPRALERKLLWLAPERIANQGVAEVVERLNAYRRLFLRTPPGGGGDASDKAFVIVFTDLSAQRAKDYADDLQFQTLKRLAYVNDGIVMGVFHEMNDGSAIRNPSFRPFRAPVPFVLMRRAVVRDWMFFLENEDWLRFWARRFEQSAVLELAGELRRTNWRRCDGANTIRGTAY